MLLLPYFTEFCTPRIPVPTHENIRTFVCSSVYVLCSANLCRWSYSAHQDNHFHTWHVIRISSSQWCASGDSWHWGARSRSFLWSASMLWQADCPGHDSPFTKSPNTQWYVVKACVAYSVVLVFMRSAVDHHTNTRIHYVKYASLQIKTVKKQPLLPIGLLTAWIIVAWGSYPDIAFVVQVVMMVI